MVTAQVNAVSSSITATQKAKAGKSDASFSEIFSKENSASAAKGSLKDAGSNNVVSEKSSKDNAKMSAQAENNLCCKMNEKASAVKNDTVSKTKDNSWQADKDVLRREFVDEPELEKQDEKAKDLMAIIMSIISNIAGKTGTDENAVKDFVASNNLTSENLLDINSWKSFVTEINGLDNISAILTNDEAFKDLGDISEIINKHLDEMGQMTAGMTEGVTDGKQVAENVFIPDEVIKKADELIREFVAGESAKEMAKEQDITVKEPSEKKAEKSEEPVIMPVMADIGNAGNVNTQAGFEQGNRNLREGNKTNLVESVGVSGKNILDNIAENLHKLETENSLPEGTTAKAILEQVTNQIKNLHAPDKTSLEFLLTPETLGKVAVNVSAKHGIMQAEFRVETAEAKAALESQMAELKLNFENQGLKVESVSVMISENGIGQDDQGKNSGEEGRKNNKKNRNFDLDGEDGIEMVSVSPEEAIRAYTDDATGSNINLGA